MANQIIVGTRYELRDKARWNLFCSLCPTFETAFQKECGTSFQVANPYDRVRVPLSNFFVELWKHPEVEFLREEIEEIDGLQPLEDLKWTGYSRTNQETWPKVGDKFYFIRMKNKTGEQPDYWWGFGLFSKNSQTFESLNPLIKEEDIDAWADWAPLNDPSSVWKESFLL